MILVAEHSERRDILEDLSELIQSCVEIIFSECNTMLSPSNECKCSTKFIDVFKKRLRISFSKGFRVANCEALELDLTFVHVGLKQILIRNLYT